MESRLTHGSLFSGIGGFELGAEWAGIKTLWNCEIEEFQRSILKKHFPNAKQYKDIKELKNPEYVDIISGGFPCQDISIANSKKDKGGINGERSGLWKEMLKVCRGVMPRYIIIENSPNLLNRMGFEQVLSDLSESGYNAEWACFSGWQFEVPTIRERLYVVAHTHEIGFFSECFKAKYNKDIKGWASKQAKLYVKDIGYSTFEIPPHLRMDNGLPYELYKNSCGAIGNSIVPQIAQYLFECIKQHNGK